MSIRIRKADKTDIPAVLAIEREQFSHPWPEKHFFAELTFEFSSFYVAENEKESEITGFIIFWLLGWTAELHNIAVKNTFQRQGIASKMLAFMIVAVLDRADEIFLEVRESNVRAIKLYEKFRFRQVGRRKGYYHHPDEDALVYRKKLKRSPASS